MSGIDSSLNDSSVSSEVAAMSPLQELPDPLLQAWRLATPPCVGSSADEIMCLRCRHRSALQPHPFTLLPLALPLAPGQVSASGAEHQSASLVPGGNVDAACLPPTSPDAAGKCPGRPGRLRPRLPSHALRL